MPSGFKDFLMRGNVVDLAVGVVIGTAFGKVVEALVADFLTPVIGAIAKVPDFSAMIFTLNGSVFKYGELINALIAFVLVAASVYFFVVIPMNKMMGMMKKKEAAPLATPEDVMLLREIRDVLKK